MVSQTQPTLVAVIGIGLVGAEFVDQLLAQPKERFQIVTIEMGRWLIVPEDIEGHERTGTRTTHELRLLSLAHFSTDVSGSWV